MKNVLLPSFLFFILLLFSIGVNAQIDNHEVLELPPECPRIVWGIDNNQVFNVDCPVGSFSINVNYDSKCLSIFNCTYSVKILFGSHVLREIQISNTQPVFVEGTYEQINNLLPNLPTPSDLKLTVIVERTCVTFINTQVPPIFSTTTVFEESQVIQVRADGQEYSVTVVDPDKPTDDIQICDQTNLDKLLCCNEDDCYIYRSDIETTLEQNSSGTWSFGISGSYKSTNGGPKLDIGGSYTLSNTIKNSFSTTNLVRSETKVCPDKGKCIYPGTQVNVVNYVEYIYKTKCGEADECMNCKDPFRIQVPVRITTFECPTTSSCDKIEYEIGTGKHKPIAGRSNCAGYIDLTITAGIVNKITWIGPDGEYGSEDLNNVPFGQYTLIIQDQCCDEYTETVYLCDDTEETDWVLDTETGKYCRTVICKGDSGKNQDVSQGDCDTIWEECVDPKPGPWRFNLSNKKCERDIFAGNDIVDTETKDAIIEESYDAIGKMCKREYFCEANGDVMHTETETPIYGNQWNFNLGTKKCERTISCFGSVVDEKDISDPVIEENYNPTTNQCTRDFRCQIGGHIVHTEFGTPIYGPWTYNPGTMKCERSVTCFGLPTQEKDVKNSTISWDYSLQTNQCTGTIFCEGIPVGAPPIIKPPVVSGNWTVFKSDPNNIRCKKTIQCEFGQFENIDNRATTQKTFTHCTTPQGTNGFLHNIYCNNELTNETICIYQASPREKNTQIPNIKINPNPFQQEVNIELELFDSELISISLITLSGKVIFEGSVPFSKGIQQFKISDLDNLQSGLYFLKFESENRGLIETKKLSKL